MVQGRPDIVQNFMEQKYEVKEAIDPYAVPSAKEYSLFEAVVFECKENQSATFRALNRHRVFDNRPIKKSQETCKCCNPAKSESEPPLIMAAKYNSRNDSRNVKKRVRLLICRASNTDR